MSVLGTFLTLQLSVQFTICFTIVNSLDFIHFVDHIHVASVTIPIEKPLDETHL